MNNSGNDGSNLLGSDDNIQPLVLVPHQNYVVFFFLNQETVTVKFKSTHVANSKLTQR